MTTTIYHNPRCSKSRQTLALLKENGVEPEIIEYLTTPPAAATLGEIAKQLGVPPRELLRTGEDEYKRERDKVDSLDDDSLLKWMTANPKVIQRPIVVAPAGARIGRPPESVLEILS